MPIEEDEDEYLADEFIDDIPEEPHNTLKRNGLTFFALREFAWRRPLRKYPHHCYLILVSMELWMIIMMLLDMFNLLTLVALYYRTFMDVVPKIGNDPEQATYEAHILIE